MSPRSASSTSSCASSSSISTGTGGATSPSTVMLPDSTRIRWHLLWTKPWCAVQHQLCEMSKGGLSGWWWYRKGRGSQWVMVV
jgi:hypothetical protein